MHWQWYVICTLIRPIYVGIRIPVAFVRMEVYTYSILYRSYSSLTSDLQIKIPLVVINVCYLHTLGYISRQRNGLFFFLDASFSFIHSLKNAAYYNLPKLPYNNASLNTLVLKQIIILLLLKK